MQPLHVACVCERIEVVQVLLTRGALANWQDSVSAYISCEGFI